MPPPTLTVGTRLGPYEIVSALGAGGMGEVYRATDTNLKRQVAIKVLPAAVAADAERLARFQREAEVLAALNHPNIAHIHGLEKADRTIALVMELVEGPTLADRIARGAIPLDEALPIAKQITEALEAAHEQGIIHRDLKPANLKVREDGTVKVLDFGLAKAMESPASSSMNVTQSPTITTPAMTLAGMIFGTAAYMSPEQARGNAVDKRADIWAFGCVLFEMLTGRRAFPGEDVTDTLAAVVRAEPDWSLLPREISPALLVFLRRSLQKDPKQRVGDIRDVRLALEGAFDAPVVPTQTTSPDATPRARWPLVLVVGTFIVGGLAAGAAVRSLSGVLPSRVERFVIPTPAEAAPSIVGAGSNVAMSADGSRVVYLTRTSTTNGALYLRDRGKLDPTLIRGTEGALSGPFFSPDGEWIAFYNGTARSLQRVSVLGGPPQTICNIDGLFRGGSWGPDDTIIFATETSKGLRRVAAAGGEPQVLTKVDGTSGETDHFWPEVLPGGQSVLMTVWNSAPAPSRIAVASLSDGHVSTLVPGGSYPRLAPTGHLLFAGGGTLRAVRFDLARLSVVGDPVTVVDGVGMSPTGAAHYAISSTGSLVYVSGPALTTAGRAMSLGFFDRNGSAELLKVPSGAYQLPRLSPDGKRIAFGSDDGKDAMIWIYDLSGASAARRLTFEGRNRFPVWSADSQRVTFQSDREKDLGIFWQRADGSGGVERLAKADEGTSYIPEAWSPDGERLLYNAIGSDSTTTLWMFSLKDRKAERFGAVVSQRASLTGAVFSPDAKWVAYASREGLRSAVYVQPSPPTGTKYLISKNDDDGHHPIWSPDGKELFFSPGPGNRLSVVSISTQPSFTVGEEIPLTTSFAKAAPLFERPYDIGRDGQRFLGLIDATRAGSAGPQPQRIEVVLNWFEELKAKVPTK